MGSKDCLLGILLLACAWIACWDLVLVLLTVGGSDERSEERPLKRLLVLRSWHIGDGFVVTVAAEIGY